MTAWKKTNPEGRIIAKDFVNDSVPHLDGEAIYASTRQLTNTAPQ